MNLPAPQAGVTQAHAGDTPLFPLYGPTGALARLRSVVGSDDLSPIAFRLYAAAVLTFDGAQWFSSVEAADAAALSDHAARRDLHALVKKKLLQSRRMAVVDERGIAVARVRYRLSSGRVS